MSEEQKSFSFPWSGFGARKLRDEEARRRGDNPAKGQSVGKGPKSQKKDRIGTIFAHFLAFFRHGFSIILLMAEGLSALCTKRSAAFFKFWPKPVQKGEWMTNKRREVGASAGGRFRVVKIGCEDGLVERAWSEYAPSGVNYRQMEDAGNQAVRHFVA